HPELQDAGGIAHPLDRSGQEFRRAFLLRYPREIACDVIPHVRLADVLERPARLTGTDVATLGHLVDHHDGHLLVARLGDVILQAGDAARAVDHRVDVHGGRDTLCGVDRQHGAVAEPRATIPALDLIAADHAFDASPVADQQLGFRDAADLLHVAVVHQFDPPAIRVLGVDAIEHPHAIADRERQLVSIAGLVARLPDRLVLADKAHLALLDADRLADRQ